MKTRIQNIIIIEAALFFASSGVSFAHDWNDRNHKAPGKAFGQNKVQKHQPDWQSKRFKPNMHYNKRFAYKQARSHRHYNDHHRYPAPRQKVIHKVVKRDPVVVFKIVLRDLR